MYLYFMYYLCNIGMTPVVWRNLIKGKHTVVIRAFCTNDDGIQTSTVKENLNFELNNLWAL